MSGEKSSGQIERATPQDLLTIMEIINDAKQLLKSRNVDQWQKGYPNEEVILQDITKGNSYLFSEEGKVVAVFALFFGEDPTYSTIEKGEWLTTNPYSVIHRIAVAQEKLGEGVMGRLLKEVGKLSIAEGYPSIRIDTHSENISMQRALLKNGFSYCGHIYLENNDLRLAYEKVWQTHF